MAAWPPLPWLGGCACDAVRYIVTGDPVAIYACHCRDCQKQTGSAYALVLRLATDDFSVDWETLAAYERTAASGARMMCHFCPDCGTRIVHTRPDRGVVNLRAGTLDDPSFIVPTAHIWTSRALPGVEFPASVYTHPGQPEDPDALVKAFRDAVPA
ncbi:aldehyde-activating protein [Acuticoccus sediminis]|uniref:Aldehyde-activating protein n=1 Tax=Acuticoccus sediminis TaxID=2184697 RepID=A0A8B2NYQ2_9HYPH|nr:GFA family protein [Acuticoccus sediminis]RAI03275.1 aldehyde-activating protein [Acuticoccus sediminis]